MNQPLDLQAGASNKQDNLPHNPPEPSLNPNPEFSKLNQLHSRNQQAMMVQEEEEVFDAIERHLQLKKEKRRNDM